MVTCVLTASQQAAKTMRSINMLTPRIWRIWLHWGQRGPGEAVHLTAPKGISLTWVSKQKQHGRFWWINTRNNYSILSIKDRLKMPWSFTRRVPGLLDPLPLLQVVVPRSWRTSGPARHAVEPRWHQMRSSSVERYGTIAAWADGMPKDSSFETETSWSGRAPLTRASTCWLVCTVACPNTSCWWIQREW